jgi:hypothetical protein
MLAYLITLVQLLALCRILEKSLGVTEKIAAADISTAISVTSVTSA